MQHRGVRRISGIWIKTPDGSSAASVATVYIDAADAHISEEANTRLDMAIR